MSPKTVLYRNVLILSQCTESIDKTKLSLMSFMNFLATIDCTDCLPPEFRQSLQR